MGKEKSKDRRKTPLADNRGMHNCVSMHVGGRECDRIMGLWQGLPSVHQPTLVCLADFCEAKNMLVLIRRY
ncbi:MAG: hypothetical protein D3910_24315 [Candidatus Electrothrix sp. ATG2]|nr:hypothetical protein [Candidatus Electrothrix sp. ATG2]